MIENKCLICWVRCNMKRSPYQISHYQKPRSASTSAQSNQPSLPVYRIDTVKYFSNQGPVVQSIVSLTSSLVVKMLTGIFAENMWVAFANAFAKATQIFSAKNISIYAMFNDQSFNDTLTNDIVSFEQLGLEIDPIRLCDYAGWSRLKMFIQDLP